jgi:4-methyl-5(b-hydroxyethyl)-thiazole monophosphate biosynthesis
MNILVPLAEGFEEMEAVVIIDVLRRVPLQVTTASTGKNPVTGSHGISIIADTDLDSALKNNWDAVILPGGMPGSTNLRADSRIISLLKKISSEGKVTGAICAAPIVLAAAGLLDGRKTACYPGYEKELAGAVYVSDAAVVDGTVVTGRGAGCSFTFALKLVEVLASPEKADELKKSMQIYWM